MGKLITNTFNAGKDLFNSPMEILINICTVISGAARRKPSTKASFAICNEIFAKLLASGIGPIGTLANDLTIPSRKK